MLIKITIGLIARSIRGLERRDSGCLKAELNPKAATLNLYAYSVPFLVLNNIPKGKKSQSNRSLTTPTYIHTGGIADT